MRILTLEAAGSGFVYDARGWIVRNAHVVTGATRADVVLSGGHQVPGVVVGRNGFVDLAVIRIDTKTPLTSLDLADCSLISVGEDVLDLGFPARGTRGTVSVSKGIVSAKDRRPDDVDYI